MGAKTDVIVKLVLVFFISLLSFSIGTFVGKKYSDNQHKLAALEPGKESSNSHEAAAEGGEHGAVAAGGEHGGGGHGGGATEGKSGEQMSDEEIAKLAEEFVADDTTAPVVKADGHGEEHGSGHAPASTTTAKKEDAHAAPAATTAAAKTRSLEKAEPLSAAKSIAHGKAMNETVPTEKKAEKETRATASIPKDVTQYTAGKFTVQVGSYAKEDEAQKMAGELKSKGYSAFYVPAAIKGQTWYRVSVGLFATPKEAQDYRNELMLKAKLNSAIVQKIIQ